MIFEDISDRHAVGITGNDRAKFLHGFCTKRHQIAHARTGLRGIRLPNIKGKVLGHIFVFCTES